MSCAMRAGRWTDMKKLIVAFRNFANAPKNSQQYAYHVSQLSISLCVCQECNIIRHYQTEMQNW